MVSWPGESRRLSRTPAATGSRWSDGANTLWIGGGRVVLEVKDAVYECRPAEATDP